MNVHPSAHDYLDRNKPLGPPTAEAFAPEALYENKIDVNGDAAADIAYRMRFSSSDFVAAFGHALEHTGGYITQEARRWQGQCCRRSSLMIPQGRRLSRRMAGPSPT